MTPGRSVKSVKSVVFHCQPIFFLNPIFPTFYGSQKYMREKRYTRNGGPPTSPTSPTSPTGRPRRFLAVPRENTAKTRAAAAIAAVT